MIQIMKYCFENRKIVSVYSNEEDTTMHLTGYIEKFNESELLLAHISAHGYYDGYILKHIEDIYRMDYGGSYERKIEELYLLKKQTHPPIDTFQEGEEEILYSLLDYAKNQRLIVSLEFSDGLLSGFVNGYDDDNLFLTLISDSGAEDGQSIVKVDEILTVSVDTDDEQDLNILHKSKKGSE